MNKYKEGSGTMKVLILAGYFPKPKNAVMGVWALEQAMAFQKNGVEIIIVSPTPWIPKVLGLSSKMKNWVSVPKEYNWDGVRTYYPRCLYYPVGTIKRVYTQFPYLQYYPVWYSVQNWMSFRRIKPNLIYCHHPLIEGLVGLAIKQKYGIPLIVIEHSLTDIQQALNHSARKTAYTRVLRSADAVITVSERLANHMRQFLGRDSFKHIYVIRNGVDTSILPPQRIPKPSVYQDRKVVLSVGWLGKRKGHRVLIQAIKEVSSLIPTVKCIIVGRGYQEGKLRKLIHQLSLEEHVELIGSMPHNEVINFMSWCDVFALPSWQEPFGVVYAEAMGCGAPIIGTKGEGIAEIIEEGKHGLLVSPKDVGSLVKALLTLLQNDNLAKQMGEHGRRLVFNSLSWQTNASKTISIFQDLLER